MADDLLFELNKNRSRTSFSRIAVLLVAAMFAVIASPTQRSSTRVASAVSANPTPVCVGAYCTVTFSYTGDYYSWTAPTTGTYDLKVWGAQGGNDAKQTSIKGGRGGYAAGTVSLTAGTQLHIYVGGQGSGCSSSGWGSSGGGGGTDIRLVAGATNNAASLLSRIIVGGGGGGRHGANYENAVYLGNDGGGASAPTYTANGYTISGASQTTGGSSPYSSSVVTGSFGFATPNSNSNTCSVGGWNGGARGSDGWANGGGGGGWYGGVTSWPTGSGGSGYVLTGSSHKPASYSPTSTYWLTNTTLSAGNESLPDPSGVGTITGREGHGIATIKYLNVPTPSLSASVSSPTNQSNSIVFTANYSETLTGIDISDFQLSGTSTGWTLTSITAFTSTQYRVTATGSAVSSGTLLFTQLANSVFGQSTQQNGPAVNTSIGPITIDVTRPTATIASEPTSPAAGMSLPFTINFSETVTGIAANDFSNIGTAVGCVFTPNTTDGTSVIVTVTQCQEGTLQLRLANAGVRDIATNTGPATAVLSSVISLQASPLTVTAGAKSINYGGSWTDSYAQSGLIGGDTISAVSYSYSGTTHLGTSYGPSASKPTAGGNYTITPTAVMGVSNSNRYSLTYVSAALTIARVGQGALTITTTSGTYGAVLSLAASGGTGTGAVSYAVSSGSCSVNGSLLTLGEAGSSCSVVVTKAADDNYTSVSSAITAISTAKATQGALSFLSTTATYGEDLVLGIAGGSGVGTVSYSVVSGTCSIVGALLTPGNAGSSCVVKATKATDTNYNELSSSNTTITVAKAVQSVLTVSTTSATYGSVLSLSTSGGSGSGAMTYEVVSGMCSVNGSSLTPSDAGSTCVVKATKATDTNYLERSSVDTTITIAKAVQSVLTVSTTSATYGQGLVLGISGGSGSGAVTYVVVSGTCSIGGALLTTGNAGSACVIKATKATDTNYLERSSVNTTISIGRASQTGLSVTSSSAFTTGSSLSLTASGGQSTGSLSWSVDSGICSLSGTSLTAPRGGVTCVVEVTRAGDSNYFADSKTQSITVDKIVQVLTFRSTPPSLPVIGGSYTVQVDSDASLAPTVAISNQSSSVCSISAGVVTFSSTGACVVSASQAGNDVYAAAAASQSINIGVVPSTTVPPAETGSGSGASSPSSTIPQSQVPVPVSTTSTTTTSTTTTVPADPGSPYLANGEAPSLDAGEATAVVRGKKVKVLTKTQNGQMIMTLPGNVILTIGSVNSASGEAQVGSDGVLRMYGNTGLSVAVDGFVPKTTYTLFMFSDPLELGRGETSSKGSINEKVLVPNDVEAGEHTLQINGVGPNAEVISVSMGFEVMERQSNTRLAVLVIMAAIALALLGGRPIFKRRRAAA